METKLGFVELKTVKASSQTSLCPARRSRFGVRFRPRASARKVSSPTRRMLGRPLSGFRGSASRKQP